MRVPTEYEIERLFHYAVGYDPVAAKKYYEEHKKLKGRKKGWVNGQFLGRKRVGDFYIEEDGSRSPVEPRKGNSRVEIARNAKARQRKELVQQIKNLEDRLNNLEALIKKRAHEDASEDRKSKAKKERSAKEKDKPATAAEKAKAARENKKYRDEHKQELKSKAKKDASSSGGGDSKSKGKKAKKHSVSELKTLATKVRGQIAVAKQKLAAL